MLQTIGNTSLQGSRIALGCMRMARLDDTQATKAVESALENGINFFDHADIYGAGESEKRFNTALSQLGVDRQNILLQSKCGIQKGYFDFSKEHILHSVDTILKRLGTDYLDILALHRPDALMDAQEVAEAFDTLKSSGKVRYFGVSNQNRYQMEYLQHFWKEPLVVNQLQFSPAHTPLIDSGLNVNMWTDKTSDRHAGIMEYCQINNVTIQAWSPFQITLQKGTFFNHPDYKNLNDTLQKYAALYNVSVEAIVIAWILRHPAKIQAVVGSMNAERIANIAKATDVHLTRQEWYDIYTSAGNVLP
ncbi:aldo/keto reductase [Carnobacteriaceae bacterium zg-ZUI240]|nr:aldo/keto reductase [Carnobacteriaceae bacterium zg-ZUI240]